MIGTTPSGQGHETSFAQCVVDWLGVPFEQIRLLHGDTNVVKEGGGSHSARSMRMAGVVMGKATDVIIERGRRIRAVLSQAENAPLSLAEQVALLLAVESGALDEVPVAKVPGIGAKLAQVLAGDLAEVADRINRTGMLDDKDRAVLLDCITGVLAHSGEAAAAKGAEDGTASQA